MWFLNYSLILYVQMINIGVYSYLSCPWCYVGNARLDKAIQKFKDASITVNWHQYIIDKNTAPLGEDYMAYNTRRYWMTGWLMVSQLERCRKGRNTCRYISTSLIYRGSLHFLLCRRLHFCWLLLTTHQFFGYSLNLLVSHTGHQSSHYLKESA